MSATSEEKRARRIETLTQELMELKREEQAEAQARRKSVTPVMEYTITPLPNQKWDKIWDDTIKSYLIEGKCLNDAELAEVGASKAFTGSMRYLFNKATGRLVGYTGGGSIFLGENAEAYRKVSEFLVANPEGGDMTDIIESTRGRE